MLIRERRNPRPTPDRTASARMTPVPESTAGRNDRLQDTLAAAGSRRKDQKNQTWRVARTHSVDGPKAGFGLAPKMGFKPRKGSGSSGLTTATG